MYHYPSRLPYRVKTAEGRYEYYTVMEAEAKKSCVNCSKVDGNYKSILDEHIVAHHHERTTIDMEDSTILPEGGPTKVIKF